MTAPAERKSSTVRGGVGPVGPTGTSSGGNTMALWGTRSEEPPGARMMPRAISELKGELEWGAYSRYEDPGYSEDVLSFGLCTSARSTSEATATGAWSAIVKSPAHSVALSAAGKNLTVLGRVPRVPRGDRCRREVFTRSE